MTQIAVCRLSGERFEIDPEEREFRRSWDLPLPTISRLERQRRLMSFRNQRHLYKRLCSLTGKPIISTFGPEYPGPVVSAEYWWSDAWSGTDFGREIDFTKPFFEQFFSLFQAVPQLCAMVTKSENCDYNAYCAASKNCYMSQSVAECENVYYTFGPTRSRDCSECHLIDGCELCYEVIAGHNCYDVRFSKNVFNCHESSFLFNCRSCTKCFFCSNLKNAEYCYRNEKLSPAEYEQRVAEYADLSNCAQGELTKEFSAFQPLQIAPALWGSQNENVNGNLIFRSKNIHDGYDVIDSEDVTNVFRVNSTKSSRDVIHLFQGEEICESFSLYRSSRVHFSFNALNGLYDIDYSASCFNACHDLFGCVGLRHQSNAILNVEYKSADYKSLRQRLIGHMKDTGEWGEFFPSSMSPFPYNDSVANDIHPLTASECLTRRLPWRTGEVEPLRSSQSASVFPERSSQATEQLCGPVFGCELCSRGFRVQKAELELLQKLRVPLPRRCSECRYQSRLRQLEPTRVNRRACAQCSTEIETCFAPDDPRKVCCEPCYLAATEF